MSSSRYQRLGRVAACTALALAAGTLLSAGPAAAAPAPKPVDKPQVLADPAQRTFERPAATDRNAPPRASAFAGGRLAPRTDFDGNGNSDLLFRSNGGYTGVLLDGASQVHDFSLYLQEDESVKDVIGLGNVRGSASPEILTVSFNGRLSLHEANSSSAALPTWSGWGWQIYNRIIAAGDLTRDGRQDLLARTPGGDLYLYRGTGNATGEPFSGRIKVGSGWGVYDQIVGVNDVDADGIADLLGRTPDGNLYYYKGTGSATAPFKTRTWVGGGWNAYNQIIATDDINYDGKADLLATTSAGKMYCYASLGGGKFTARQECGSGWTDNPLVVGAGVTPVYGKHGASGVDGAGTVYTHVSRSNGSQYDRFVLGNDWPAGTQLVMAAGLDKTNWETALGLSGGTLTNMNEGAAVSGDFANTNLVLGPGDLNGDGKGDLLSRDVWGQLWLRAGWGNGLGFSAPVKVGPGWNAFNSIAGAGDMTGDGRTDVVAKDGNGNLYLYAGTGNAAAPFAARVWVGGGWNIYNEVASPGDMTGDGRADLVARDGKGDLYRYQATGLGGTKTFTARQYVGWGWNTYSQVD
ncbi:FG-GAP repeat domain-containing protein [Streptomyces sp. NPDC012888]|uniref:FG-GAP repeat domain-containing protein n=1 Tax=Streptomyces sp. NPDC012888 TaxID=3364855 RepID=UPI0036A2B6EC